MFLFDYSNEIDSMVLRCYENNIPFALWARDSNSLKNYKQGVTYEIPGMGRKPETIEEIVDDVISYIKLLGQNNVSLIQMDFDKRMKFEVSPFTGLIKWAFSVENSPFLAKDTEYADLYNLRGRKIYTFKSPVTGYLVDNIDRDFIVAGQEIASFQPSIVEV